MSGILSKLGLKQEPEPVKDPRCNHTFSDEDRENAKITRSINNQIKDLEKTLKLKTQMAKLKMLQDGIQGDASEEEEGDSMMNQALGIIMTNMMNKQQQPPPEPQQVQIDLNDDELKQILDEQLTKTQRKMAKKMPPDTVKKLVIARFPNLSMDTIERGIKLL